MYSGDFDAKAYWARKPYCQVCRTRKVKTGTICYQCKTKLAQQETVNQINSPSEDTAIKTAPNSVPVQNTQEPIETPQEPKQYSQIKFDKSFIKKLLDKLKVGNARSIHLNAIPGRSATRLDLFQLSEIDEEIPSEFLKSLLENESFSYSVSFDKVDLGELTEDQKNQLALIAKRLNNIVIEKEDNFLEFGLQNFGFGFPLLIKRDQNDPSKIIKAPIFIWDLDIERSYRNKNNWTINKDAESPIKINELLIAHLSKDESVRIEKLSEELLEDGFLDQKELLDVCNKILTQLNAQPEKLEFRIEKCPDAKQIESIANSKPWIQWSGIFGIYRSQNETIIHSTEELLDRFDEFNSAQLELEKFQTSSISAIETDPSEEEIINTLTKDEIKLIQGPPGTGKSQSITAIVANALANNTKCLIVCEKKTALDVIQANLEKADLGNYSVVIDDVNKDRRRVIEKARNINDNRSFRFFWDQQFTEKYNQFCSLKKEINEKHSEALKNVFGNYTWKNLIGLYLKIAKRIDLELIGKMVDANQLKFDHQEYTDLRNIIEEATFLISDLGKESDDNFWLLNKKIFESPYKWKTQEGMVNELDKTLETVKELSSLISKIGAEGCAEKDVSVFKPTTIETSIKLIESLNSSIKEIIDQYKKGLELFGDNFNKKGYLSTIKYRFPSIFSKKYKNICQIRSKISKLEKNILQDIKNIRELGLDCPDIEKISSKSSAKILKQNCTSSQSKLKKLEVKLKIVKENEQKIKKLFDQLEKIHSEDFLEYDFKNYTTFKDSAKLLEYIDAIKDRVEVVRKNIDSYESYHNWRFFRDKQNGIAEMLLYAIRAYPNESSMDVFNAWYYKAALLNFENNSSVGFHKSDGKLKQLSAIYKELKDLQTKQIESNWGTSRRNALSSIRFNFNTLYNLRRNNAGPKSPLRKIIATDFSLFTTLFPVILTNPVAANAIFPLELGLFDIVIFDEASQLRVSDTFTSLIRGQYKIIAGDEHQMPPSNYFQSTSELADDDFNEEISAEEQEQSVLAEAESLLQYSSDLKNINKSYLDFHYRSHHPALIDFSNCAFYGGNLVPLPPTEVYKPIEFRAVNGRYDTRTNPSEVVEIIKIIKNEIHPDEKGKFPSVGIATFNINQRNLITEALNECSEKDTSFRKKLQELRESGLFVKNLENIQGDEKDIIIISTTYGVQADGRFVQNFARLNRIEGYKLLNVLITRARHKVYVCTSIPKDRYLTWQDTIEEEGNNKRGILYAYLAYAEAVSTNDTELATSILQKLKEQSWEKPREIMANDGLSESPFEEEVYESLLDFFEKDKVIQQYKVGGYRIDFVIHLKSRDLAIECDGKEWHNSEEAYAHDMYREKQLKQMGFAVFRIWSTNWFQDKDNEMRKLTEFAQSLDKL